MIYLDHASTSFPKPPACISGITNYLQNIGVTPHRGSSPLEAKAQAVVAETQSQLAQLLGTDQKDKIVLTPHATFSLNLIIKGYLKSGDHAIVCSWNHNSVLRPLHYLSQEQNVTYSVFDTDLDGSISLLKLQALVTEKTKLMIFNHASNVTGHVLDLASLAAFRKTSQIPILLDATQAIGTVGANYSDFDFVVGTGHKALLGPTGVGFFFAQRPEEISPLLHGGTGSSSFSLYQPTESPERFNTGTPNMTSIAGLNGSLSYLLNSPRKHVPDFRSFVLRKLLEFSEVEVLSQESPFGSVPIVAFHIKNALPHEISRRLSDQGIATRSGLHCAPLLHKRLDNINGCVRISFGLSNTEEEVLEFIKTLKDILSHKNYTRIAG